LSRIVRSIASFRDASDIWHYIARDDPDAATRQIGRFDARLLMLADTPLAGAARPEFGRNTRSFVVGNYLIVYRLLADGVRLIRILNAARDIKRTLRR
jgi:toxin ParE1/3/4